MRSVSRTLTFRSSGRPLFIVSDLHLGRRPPFGFPYDLEPVLAGAVRDAARRGEIIVLNGDILEVRPPTSPFATLARYRDLVDALGDATSRTDVIVTVGNHDEPAETLSTLLPWAVTRDLVVDGHTLVCHGDRFDRGLHGTTAGRMHALHERVEDVLGAPIDLPLGQFHTLRNRAIVSVGAAIGAWLRELGPRARRWVDDNFAYIASLELLEDPRFVLACLSEEILHPAIRTVVCGHTHHPGIADLGHLTYVNSGTWSPHLATAVRIEGEERRVFDIVRGREHGLEAYARWRARTPWQEWWDRARPELRIARLAEEMLSRVRPRATSGGVRPTMPIPLRFDEHLSGHARLVDDRGGDAIPLDLDLTGDSTASASSLTTATVELGGTIRAPGLVDDGPCEGTLRLSTSEWEYELAFVGDDRRPYRLIGRKIIRVFDLKASLTTLHGEIFDARGRVVAEVELTFDLATDLGRLIRSITFTGGRGAPALAGPLGAGRGAHELGAEVVEPPFRLEPLASARGTRVAVTGAAGHLGFTLVEQLVDRGYDVRAVVRSLREDGRLARLRAFGPQVEIVAADVLSPREVHAALDGELACIFHAAAGFDLAPRDEERDVIEPTVRGTMNVLRAATRTQGLRRVIVTSAAGTTGHDARGRDLHTERDWNTTPRIAYLRAKTEAERQAWDFAEEQRLDLVTLLPSAMLGPGFLRHTPVTRLFDEVTRGSVPLLPRFAGSWVDVRDVARAHVLAFENEHANGRYLVSTLYSSWRGVLERAAAFDRTIRLPPDLPDVLIGTLPALDWARARVCGSTRALTRAVVDELWDREPRYDASRIQRELGWEPTDFDRTVADTLRWLRGPRATRTSSRARAGEARTTR